MIKVGLVGEGIDKSILRQYPILLEKAVFINVKGHIEAVIQGQVLREWLAKDTPADQETGFQTNTATISLLLQAINAYDDVSLVLSQVPVFPPETGMLALSALLEYMAVEVKPDFLHIGFSSPEGKYQKQQHKWLEELYGQGCKVICPTGIPPAFPASLNHVTSVADQGFIEAGFGFSNPDVIIDQNEVGVYADGAWVKQHVSNEVASALVLSNLIRERLALSEPKTDNLVQLPDLEDLDFPVFEHQGADAESYIPPRPGLFQKAKFFTKSLLSRVITPTGKVPAFVKEIRQVSCNGDNGAIKPCDFRVRSKTAEGAFVCGACGCGDRESVFVGGPVPKFEKLDYPYISCPASMPGFSNYLSSADESNPSERKVAIETKFGQEAIAKGQQAQKRLTDRLDRRLSWLDRF